MKTTQSRVYLFFKNSIEPLFTLLRNLGICLSQSTHTELNVFIPSNFRRVIFLFECNNFAPIHILQYRRIENEWFHDRWSFKLEPSPRKLYRHARKTRLFSSHVCVRGMNLIFLFFFTQNFVGSRCSRTLQCERCASGRSRRTFSFYFLRPASKVFAVSFTFALSRRLRPPEY